MESPTKRVCSSSNSGDKLSTLHESILHRILSYLDMKDVIRTSLLSNTWRYFWISTPFLTFNNKQFFQPNKDYNQKHFIDFVDRVLYFRDSSTIQTFNLVWDTEYCKSRHVDSWLRFAVSGNIQQLDLQFYPDNRVFVFPPCLFTSEFLISLKLFLGFNDSFHTKIVLPKRISLPLLRTLNLRSITFSDGKVLERILFGCPVLECLKITDCKFTGFNSLTIDSVQLKELVIETCDWVCGPNQANGFKIIVYSPNLVKFRLKHKISRTGYFLQNVSGLENAEIDMIVKETPLDDICAKCMVTCLRGVCNAKSLTLSVSLLEVLSDCLDVLESQLSPFENLRHLKVKASCTSSCIRSVTWLLKSSLNVETFTMYIDETESCSTQSDTLSEKLSSQCMLHHLKSIEIRQCRGCQKEVNFMEFLLKSALNLEKLIIAFSPNCTQEKAKQIREELLKLPRASPYTEIYFL